MVLTFEDLTPDLSFAALFKGSMHICTLPQTRDSETASFLTSEESPTTSLDGWVRVGGGIAWALQTTEDLYRSDHR